MQWSTILQLIGLAISVAILVVLIVLLSRNAIEGTEDPNLLKINNKINALYILEIISVGIMVLFGVIALVMYRRLPAMC
jgi:hypothetical protein